MNAKDSESQNPIDARLKQADPAKRYRGKPGAAFLASAIESAKDEARKPARTRFSFQNSLQRGLAIGAAAVLALAIVVPSALNFGKNPALINVSISAERGGSAAMASDAAGKKLPGYASMECFGCGFTSYSYQDGGLSKEAGSAHIYQMVPMGDPATLGKVLAATFGQKGELKLSKAPDQETYYFGDIDPLAVTKADNRTDEFWSSAQTLIYWSKSNPSWNFNDPSAMVQYSCGEADKATDGGASSGASGADGSPSANPGEPTPDPEPCKPIIPADAKPISSSDAKQAGMALFRGLGYEVGTTAKHTANPYLMVQVHQDEWNMTVTGFLVVEGHVTNQQIGINWDSKTGKLASAWGMYSKVKDVGAYSLVSPAAALPRLTNFAYSGDFWADWDNFKWSTNMNGMVSMEGDVGVMPGEAPSEPEVVTQTPTITQITVTRSEFTLMGLWATDGVSWLVPGYLYFDDTGYVGNTLAVEEGVVSVPDYGSGVVPMTK